MGDIPNPNATPPPSTPPPGANIGIISRVANIGRTMYRVTRGTAALIGIGTIVVGYGYLATKYKPLVEFTTLPQSMVLKLSLDNGIKEHHQPGKYDIAAYTGVTPLTLRELTNTIDFAIKDDRVKALYVELPDYRAVGGLAQVQELRDKITEFQKANKIAVVYSNEFNQNNYYLASSFSKIFMLPVGHLWLTGLHSSTFFFKDMLDKLGIVAKFAHAGDFKTAPNMFTERKFTSEHRQQVDSILISVYSQLLQGIASSRKLSVDQVNTMVNEGPHFASVAKENKLIDGLAYEDQVLDALKKLTGNAEVIPFRRYCRLVSQSKKITQDVPKIALIYATGNIAPDLSESPEPGVMTPKQMAKAFNAAIEDPNVKAIVIRMDSPGGSAVASDCIWRNVVRAQKAGKKVIASVGNVAASGGYYIIAPCDKIVAQPGSITGSIGVFGGKMLVRDFLENKVGITEDSVKIGANSDAMSAMEDFTPAQWERFQKSIDHTYEIFLDRVSKGRKIEMASLLHIAGGRVFTGEQAKEVGLIDEFGGLEKAIQIAKEMTELPTAHVHVYPPKLGFFKQLQQMRDGENSSMKISMVGILESEMREMMGSSFGVHPWLFTQMLAKPTVMTIATNPIDEK